MNLKPAIRLSFLALIILLVLYYLTQGGYMGDNPVGRATGYEQPLVVPASYAFAIWSIIYLLMFAFPIYHWFKRPEGHPLWKKVHLLFALNMVANGLWLVCASYNWQILMVLIILFMLYTLYTINDLLIAIEVEEKPQNYWLERIGFSIYFAWITLASALNISTLLAFYGFEGLGISQVIWSVIFLIVVSLIAALVYLKYRDRAYVGVVLWAFTAIVVKQLDPYPMIAYTAIAMMVIFVILIFTKVPTKAASV